MFAAITASGLISLVITIIVVGLIFWVLNWAIGAVGLGEPFAKIAKVVLVLVAVLFLCNALLSLTGHGFISW